jgi:amidase
MAHPAPFATFPPVMDLDLAAVTGAELTDALGDGRLTSRELVQAHLDRIEALDGTYRSVRCVAPDALAQADASDAVRRSGGRRSALEGIPVLIKDNIDVAGLPTTGGALALERSFPPRDAHLVARLRNAGAVILGKTNLSELANFLTEDMPSGYSSLGGQVLNAYDTALTPSGSSSGSATAVALGLAPLAVGTETDGSITSPAEHQSLVGCKPTVGRVSRHGILPISVSQDTAGPMARTVADAAALLRVLSGPDEHDPATRRAPDSGRGLASAAPSGGALSAADLASAGPDPAGPDPAGPDPAGLDPAALDHAALVGARLGVVPAAPAGPGADQGRPARYAAALDALRRAGAVLVEVTLPAATRDDELAVLHHEFGSGLDRYLGALGPDAPVRSLEELHAWNLRHAAVALKFGQRHVDIAVAIDRAADLDRYLSTRARDLAAATDALEAALTGGLEALVFPGSEGCSWAARAGWPSVVVPAGYSDHSRRPVGVMLVSRPWTESQLLSLAYSFEQATRWRRPPAEIDPAMFRFRQKRSPGSP